MIKVLTQIDYVGKLVKHYDSDAGWDLSVESVKFDSHNNVWIVDTGVRLAPNNNDLWFMVVPRSSIFKLGYFMVNSVGVIDPEYRGTIKVILSAFRDDPVKLTKGLRIAQLIPIPKSRVIFSNILEKEFNDKSKRGTDGLGSTGQK